jgi:TetR/AcrR family transcriptional regulator, ethionamide resistance regulator
MEIPPASFDDAGACVAEPRTYRVTDAVSIEAATTRPTRRRRTPESAEREILEAAESFLRERPFRDLSVDEVMARTTLSRPSFYVYFRDRHQLLVKLVEGIGGELFEGANTWLEGDGDMRESLAAVAEVYARHGLVLGAIADAAGHDPDVESTYRALIERFVATTTERVERDIAAGRVEPLDAGESARALVWMSERYFKETLGRLPQAPLGTVLDALAEIWERVLYRPSPKPA